MDDTSDSNLPTTPPAQDVSVPGDMPSLKMDTSNPTDTPKLPAEELSGTLPPVGAFPAEPPPVPTATTPSPDLSAPPTPAESAGQSPLGDVPATAPATSDWGIGRAVMSSVAETPADQKPAGSSETPEPSTPPATPEPFAPAPPEPQQGETGPEPSPTPSTENPVSSAPQGSPQAGVSASSEETLVIPPSSANAANPFIPQGAAPTSNPPPASGNPLIKRIFTILLVLLVVAGIGIGGFFAYQKFGGSKQVALTYWGLWENNTTTATMINNFQTQNPNIKITYVKQSPRQYRERLQAAIARGEGPDVFEFHNTWVPMLRNELSPAPATVMTAAEFGTTFYPVASADLVGGSAVYGMPMMFDGLGLYYNVDLLSTAGVTPPTTWPELLDIVPKLTVRADTQIQKSAIALGTTGNVENFSDILALMMMQNGAKLVSPTGKEAEDTLTFYRKFANPSDPVYTWNESMDNSVYAFATSKVAMIIAPSWRVFDIKQINPQLNFKIVGVPQLPGNTINWASYWVEGVSAKSKSQEAAWTFVKYLTSKDTVTSLYAEEAKARLFGEPYARVDLASTLATDPYVGAYIAEAPTAKSFPLASRTFDNGINDKLIKYMEDAVNSVGGGSAPTQALDTMSQGFTQVLGSYGLSAGAPAASPTP